MKKTLYIIALCALTLGATGCDKMLDNIKPKHAIKSDALTDNELNKLTNGILNRMESDVFALWFDSDKLGEEFVPGPGFNFADVHAPLESPSNSTSLNHWRTCFTNINATNELLKATAASSSNSENLRTCKGTGYFCRAYMYFMLVQRFGNVPILTSPTTSLVPISEEKLVWAQIEKDLESAEEYLGDFQNAFYPSKASVYLLSAKVQLWLGTFFYKNDKTKADAALAKAVEMADKVIATPGLKLVNTSENFARMFVDNGNKDEYVFVLANKRQSYQKRLYEAVNDVDASWNYAPQPELHAGLFADSNYGTGDIRKAPTFSEEDKTRIIKFPNGGSDMNQYIGNEGPSTSPLMVMRLADAYLIKAEAQGAAAGLATLKTFMDSRYETVNLPAGISEADFKTLVLDENHREFYAEGRRCFDIKRTGRTDLYKEWKGRDKLLYWPIPQYERDLAGHEAYPQNPGYTD